MSIKNQTKMFLEEEGMFKDEVNDPNANFHFVIQVLNFNLDVVQPKGKHDSLVIGCASQLAPEQIEIMKTAKNKIYNEFLWDLRIDLNSFLVDFQLNINPQTSMLEQYIITDYFFFDEISKNDLLQTIKKVSKAKIQCEYIIGKTFGEVAPTQTQPQNENSMFV